MLREYKSGEHGLVKKYRQNQNLVGYVNDKLICETECNVFSTETMQENDVMVARKYVVLMDAVPGRVNTVWFAPVEVGEHDIQCREYCGLIHYNMRGTLIVEEPSS